MKESPTEGGAYPVWRAERLDSLGMLLDALETVIAHIDDKAEAALAVRRRMRCARRARYTAASFLTAEEGFDASQFASGLNFEFEAASHSQLAALRALTDEMCRSVERGIRTLDGLPASLILVDLDAGFADCVRRLSTLFANLMEKGYAFVMNLREMLCDAQCEIDRAELILARQPEWIVGERSAEARQATIAPLAS